MVSIEGTQGLSVISVTIVKLKVQLVLLSNFFIIVNHARVSLNSYLSIFLKNLLFSMFSFLLKILKEATFPIERLVALKLGGMDTKTEWERLIFKLVVGNSACVYKTTQVRNNKKSCFTKRSRESLWSQMASYLTPVIFQPESPKQRPCFQDGVLSPLQTSETKTPDKNHSSKMASSIFQRNSQMASFQLHLLLPLRGTHFCLQQVHFLLP